MQRTLEMEEVSFFRKSWKNNYWSLRRFIDTKPGFIVYYLKGNKTVKYYSYYIFILFQGPMNCCGRYLTHFTKKTCCNLHARHKTPASMVHILLKSKLNISMNGSSSHSEVGQSQQILLERGWPTVVGWLRTTIRGFCLWSVTVW